MTAIYYIKSHKMQKKSSKYFVLSMNGIVFHNSQMLPYIGLCCKKVCSSGYYGMHINSDDYHAEA